MKMRTVMLMGLVALSTGGLHAEDAEYRKKLETWREAREKSLRAENGWLTLVGRFPLKAGVNTFGTGADNDVVFPPELKGVGPARLGAIEIDPASKDVIVRPATDVTFKIGDTTFNTPRPVSTSRPVWVRLERLSFQIIQRENQYFLRLADNEAETRKNFPGRIWYPPNEDLRVTATFRAYPAGKTIRVVNILDRASEQPSPGYAEFTINGTKYQLDAIDDDGGLFFVFRDATAGDTTYKPARFLSVEGKPTADATFVLDFNKAYNPPCAVSAYTTCPTSPKQNILPVRIEAGEKYRKPGQ